MRGSPAPAAAVHFDQRRHAVLSLPAPLPGCRQACSEGLSGTLRPVPFSPVASDEEPTDAMRKELFAELLKSVKQAKAIERGEMNPSRVFKLDAKNSVVKARAKLGLAQAKVAALLGISGETLQNWEQGRREPSGPAKV